MALVWKDRVLETTTTTGTGTLTLAGAVTGYQTFAAIGDGNTAYYCIYAVDGFGNPSGVWEVGLGTYTASGTTLARTAVYANSSGTQVALDLAAGTKRVMLTAAAQHLTTIPVVNGGTGLTALGSALQVLRTNAGATAAEWATLSTGLTVGTTAITSGTSGRLLYDAAGTLGETAAVTYSTSTPNLTVTASGAAVVPLVVKGATSQTANLTEWQNSAGTRVLSVADDAGFSQGIVSTARNDLVLRGGVRVMFMGSGIGYAGGFIGSDFHLGAGVIKWNGLADNAAGGSYNLGLNQLSAGVLSINDAETAGNTSIYVQALSSTSTRRTRHSITTAAVDNTDATRKYRAVLSAWDTAERECLRLEASGSAAMLGLYGTAATVQYATTGTVTGHTGGGGTALTHSDTFTGNTGATAYTIGDIVRALKLLGVIAA